MLPSPERTHSSAIELYKFTVRNLEGKGRGVALFNASGVVVCENGLFSWACLAHCPEFLSHLQGVLGGSSQFTPEQGLAVAGRVFEISMLPIGAEHVLVVAQYRSDNAHFNPLHQNHHANLYLPFFDMSSEAIFRTTLAGRIVFFNAAFLEILRLQPDANALNGELRDFFVDTNQHAAISDYLLRGDPVLNEVVVLKRFDGTEITARVNAKMTADENGNAVLNWAVLDITRQVESENALKLKNEQLKKVNHQMEKFLYSASHDLRSPITSILGLINLMRIETSDPTLRDYIARMETSTLRLDQIIKNIMSFSRASYQHITSERIDFSLLAWKVINQYRKDPATRKIMVDVKVEGTFPFFGDPDRLEIIFDNIISNAVQFYDGAKSRPFITVTVQTTGSKSVIEFIDNGIGIGKMHMENIFNMFYKASHISKGAGLGLFVVREALEDMRGSITVESEVGFGTVFRVEIPNDRKGKLIGKKLSLGQFHAEPGHDAVTEFSGLSD